jgi:putative transposase
MLGISRWTEKGGSERTVQRFFSEHYNWGELRWLLIKQYLKIQIMKSYILVGDEVVVTKSGKHTHGLGKFYSSIQKQSVSGLCFISLSLIDVESRKAYPLLVEQLVREEAKKTAPKAVKDKASKGKVGRPKGSKNKSRTDVELSPFLTQLQGCIRQALLLIGVDMQIAYFVYDGALGNNAAMQMVKQTGLFLISKMRHDAELYFPYTGEYSGKGAPQKYGERVTRERHTDEYLCSETVEKNIKICVYQLQVWHKKFPTLLNVVFIVKTNLKTGKMAKVLLFCNDLELAHDT